MKIAILSDTHSRYHTVEKALTLLQQRNVNFVLHCGDIEDADTVWLFHGFTAHFVYGNCDTERVALQQAVYGIGGELHRPFGRLELEGVKIVFLHGDDKHRSRSRTGSYATTTGRAAGTRCGPTPGPRRRSASRRGRIRSWRSRGTAN